MPCSEVVRVLLAFQMHFMVVFAVESHATQVTGYFDLTMTFHTDLVFFTGHMFCIGNLKKNNQIMRLWLHYDAAAASILLSLPEITKDI